MGYGIYSALGSFDDRVRDEVTAILRRFCVAVDQGDDITHALPRHAHEAGAAAVRAIRLFELRVGQPTGASIEWVTASSGPAIELGNQNHIAFGRDHGRIAMVVATTLADLLTALGATRVFPFIID